MPRGRHLTANYLKLVFHQRLALCSAAAALGLLAVTTATAIRSRNLARTVLVGFAGLYVFAWFGGDPIVAATRPAISAWTPNAGAAAISIILLGVASHRRTLTLFRPD